MGHELYGRAKKRLVAPSKEYSRFMATAKSNDRKSVSVCVCVQHVSNFYRFGFRHALCFVRLFLNASSPNFLPPHPEQLRCRSRWTVVRLRPGRGCSRQLGREALRKQIHGYHICWVYPIARFQWMMMLRFQVLFKTSDTCLLLLQARTDRPKHICMIFCVYLPKRDRTGPHTPIYPLPYTYFGTAPFLVFFSPAWDAGFACGA